MKRPVSVINPMYSASAIVSVHQVPDDLRRARRLGYDQVHRPEAGVVVVMVEVEDVRAWAPQRLGGIAVEVAAVEEHDRPLLDVDRRAANNIGQRQEPILGRQRELSSVDEHHAVLAECDQDLLHRDQRSQRVAVRVLVRHDHQLARGSKLLEHLVACRDRAIVRHTSSPGFGSASSIRREIRIPRSTDSS
jgi:hypothetical protein